MRRRTFLATLPLAAAASTGAGAAPSAGDAGDARADVHGGDRITGASFARYLREDVLAR